MPDRDPTTPIGRLAVRLANIETALHDVEVAIRRSASRRSTAALALAVFAIVGMLISSSIAQVHGQRDACQRRNELQGALDRRAVLEREAMLAGFVEVLSTARDPDAAARTRAAGAAILTNVAANPGIVANQADLAPRDCTVHPLDYLGF